MAVCAAHGTTFRGECPDCASGIAVAEVEEFDPSQFRASMASMRQFTRRMMSAWFVIFPVVVLNQPVAAAIKTGHWAPIAFVSPIVVLVMWVCWRFRKAMAVLFDDQDLDERHADLVRAHKKREIERLAAEERAAAEAEAALERAQALATVEDLVELRDEFSDAEDRPADI